MTQTTEHLDADLLESARLKQRERDRQRAEAERLATMRRKLVEDGFTEAQADRAMEAVLADESNARAKAAEAIAQQERHERFARMQRAEAASRAAWEAKRGAAIEELEHAARDFAIAWSAMRDVRGADPNQRMNADEIRIATAQTFAKLRRDGAIHPDAVEFLARSILFSSSF